LSGGAAGRAGLSGTGSSAGTGATGLGTGSEGTGNVGESDSGAVPDTTPMQQAPARRLPPR
jgi:hypothetical protein